MQRLLTALLMLTSPMLAQKRALGGPTPAHLTGTQVSAIQHVLLDRMGKDGWCTPGEDSAFVKDLTFESVPLGNKPIILVSPGAGCARGGQGSNSALWLFELASPTPRLIGSPAEELSGWWQNVLPYTSHGLHNFTVGWHMGAADMSETTFRFDGKTYRAVHTKQIKFKE